MKYIFRYTVVTHFTDNTQKMNKQDLIEALHSHKFAHLEQWQQLVEYSKSCIEELIKCVQKDNVVDFQTEIVRSYLEKVKMQEFFDDIVHIWEGEKHKVVGKIVKDAVRTGEKFNSINWQVNSNISNHANIQLPPIAFISLNTADGKSQFEANKQEMKRIEKSFEEAEQFLNQYLS